MSFLIRKSTGVLESFDEEKLKRSLIRPGASEESADKIIHYIKKNIFRFKSTEDIYRFALDKLIEENPPIAARYNLKRSLLEFGPTGFPFEKYIAEVLKAHGYKTKLNQIIKGWCVDHEVDIVVTRNSTTDLVECKFHNELYFRTNVKVPLYTKARLEDIKKMKSNESLLPNLNSSWVFTNTKFTYESIKYGNCIGIKLTSWDYPKEENLARLIDASGLHPITCLNSLNIKQKQHLLNEGLVLCKDATKYKHEIKKIHAKYDEVIYEAEKTCRLNFHS